MKFSGKMCLRIILKVTKNQDFTLCLEDAIFKKLQGVEVKLPPPLPPPAVLGLKKKEKLNLLSNKVLKYKKKRKKRKEINN